MKKKIIFKYILLCLPFFVGSLLFYLEIYNIISSLLFFVGGYVSLKNIFDYRKVKKNINLIENNNNLESSKKEEYQYITNNSVIGLKRTNRYERVRKRIKR